MTRRSELKRTVVAHPDGSATVQITPAAYIGTTPVSVHLNASQYTRYLHWRRGDGLLQNLLPELSADDREKLISGLSNDDFQRIARGGADE
jgi:hypothetical protein